MNTVMILVSIYDSEVTPEVEETEREKNRSGNQRRHRRRKKKEDEEGGRGEELAK